MKDINANGKLEENFVLLCLGSTLQMLDLDLYCNYFLLLGFMFLCSTHTVNIILRLSTFNGGAVIYMGNLTIKDFFRRITLDNNTMILLNRVFSVTFCPLNNILMLVIL